jgi:lipopolysaccharide transport system permease protein
MDSSIRNEGPGLGVSGVRQSDEIETLPIDKHGLQLPEKPLVTIEPSGLFVALDLRSVWHHRELLYFLTWRDVKVRYKQTALGVLWAMLQPLLMMLIFSLFFGRIAGIASDGLPYPLFAFAGLLPWTFFANAISNSGNSVVGGSHLVTKVYFPRLIIPAAAIGASLVDLLLSFVLLVPLMLYYRVPLTLHILALPLFIGLASLLALGVGMWMAAMNVKYRDIRFALPFLVQIWMFLSPVIYPTSVLPPKVRMLLSFNPMTGIVEGLRSTLFGLEFKWDLILISTVITLLVLVYAAYTFRSMEKNFADII